MNEEGEERYASAHKVPQEVHFIRGDKVADPGEKGEHPPRVGLRQPLLLSIRFNPVNEVFQEVQGRFLREKVNYSRARAREEGRTVPRRSNVTSLALALFEFVVRRPGVH